MDDLPNVLSDEDALALENVTLRKDLYDAQAANLRLQLEHVEKQARDNMTRGTALGLSIRDKYKISDGDEIDIGTRAIKRRIS